MPEPKPSAEQQAELERLAMAYCIAAPIIGANYQPGSFQNPLSLEAIRLRDEMVRLSDYATAQVLIQRARRTLRLVGQR